MPALIRISFCRLTGPGMPTYTGRVMPPRSSDRSQATVVAASKQIWVTTCVACSAFARSASSIAAAGIDPCPSG